MKQLVNTMALLWLGTGLGNAASLQVYQNSAVYTYAPETRYLGMVEHATATCRGEPLSLVRKTECDSSDRLCRAYYELLETKQKLNALDKNIKLLDQIVSLHQPASFVPEASIEAAAMLAKESARVDLLHQKTQKELQLQTEAYRKQTRAKHPLYYTRLCDEPVTLALDHGKISFQSLYEADLSQKGEIKVTQSLAVTNRSGLDIRAKDAVFYNRPAQKYLRPIHFTPWIVSEYKPPAVTGKYAKARSEAVMMEADTGMAVPAAGTASYIDAREYRAADLTLPSTGVPVNVDVISWKAPLTCGIRVYPYRNTAAYETCTFTPKTQIENNRWKIKEGKKIINNRAAGEYRDQQYHLYTKVDEDIRVTRKPIVKKEKDTGFFGDTVRKKDGYTLTVTNKSDKNKSLAVTERMPASTTEKIEVKFLHIRSSGKIEYKLLKDGKIEMSIHLAPGEEKKIEV
ncbi:MAG: DUF4139 domain-containing protein, partial [Sulfurimonas sp.]